MWTIFGILHVISILYFIYGCFEYEAFYMHDIYESKELIKYAALRLVYYVGVFFTLMGIGYMVM